MEFGWGWKSQLVGKQRRRGKEKGSRSFFFMEELSQIGVTQEAHVQLTVQ